MATNTQLQETPEYRIFREHYDRLVTAILDPLLLATRLFARNIIDSTVKEQMSVLGLSRVYKNNALLSAVELQVQTDQRMFDVFLSALNEDPSMQSLVESMQSKCFVWRHKFPGIPSQTLSTPKWNKICEPDNMAN